MAILASYDEAFGPSNPHTTRYHEDFSWSEDFTTWDDDIVALVHSVISSPQRARALVRNLTAMRCDECEAVITAAQATWLSDDCPVCSTCAQVTVGA